MSPIPNARSSINQILSKKASILEISTFDISISFSSFTKSKEYLVACQSISGAALTLQQGRVSRHTDTSQKMRRTATAAAVGELIKRGFVLMQLLV